MNTFRGLNFRVEFQPTKSAKIKPLENFALYGNYVLETGLSQGISLYCSIHCFKGVAIAPSVCLSQR